MNLEEHMGLALEIHADNRRAGWWTDLVTEKPLNRNFGEMVALVHSELSECWEGIALQKADDHLPEFPMYKVEIADACIRVYDILGGYYGYNLFPEKNMPGEYSCSSEEDRLIILHYLVSQALEGQRKSRTEEAKGFLYKFLDACFHWAHNEEWDLLEVIHTKREYNRSRADHKIENRLLADGKKI